MPRPRTTNHLLADWIRRSALCLLGLWIYTAPLSAKVPEFQIEDFVEGGIDIDLRDPSYSDGLLTTDKGGVITASDLRIQAKSIAYLRQKKEGTLIETITAEGDLFIEFGDYTFVGKRLEYNIQTESGVIYGGRTAIEPWYFGGDRIDLLPDKSIILHHGFITTSADECPDWAIESDQTTLTCQRYLQANNVKFKVLNVPFFWLPKFKADLCTIFDSPIRYAVRFGGKQGPRARLIYEVFSWYRLKTFIRLEYRLNRGPGGGIITDYHSLDHKKHLEMINYVARDSSVEHPSEKFRYRFQGRYRHLLNDDRTNVELQWDKLSDKYMAEDYNDETLKIYEAGLTQLQIRHEENSWIANFLTTLQVNNFQTVKQEIPVLEWRFRPCSIGNSGIISETLVRAGYLDYDYASNLKNVHDYCSTRFEFRQNFIRPFHIGAATATPQACLLAIHYGNSPQKVARELTTGLFSFRLNTHIYRFYGENKHVVEPYAFWRYYTSPTTNPNHHFIFDIEDGWYRLNTVRMGINNNFYTKSAMTGCVHRYLQVDLFTNAFIDTETIPMTFQKVYCDISFSAFSDLKNTIATAWNIQENQLDYFNLRLDWTYNANLAVAMEYRHRGPYDWRKVDYDNFVLDSYRSVEELRHSALSDRRDTLLLHTFYRFHPYWAFEFQVRHGWNRQFEPEYVEYQTDLITNLGSAWNLRLSYQHKEDDHRVAFYFTLGAKRPTRAPCQPIPCIEF